MRRGRLFWRIFPAFLVVTLLGLAAVSWHATGAARSFYLEQIGADLAERLRLLMPEMVPRLRRMDAAGIDAACKAIGAGDARTRVTVIGPDGRVLGDSRESPSAMDNHLDRPEFRQALSGGRGMSVRYSRTLDHKMMYVALAVPAEGAAAGVLRASVPIDAIDARLRGIRMRISYWGAAIAVLCGLIGFWIARRIARPIEEMKQGADRFAAGELDYRLAAPGVAEMDALARSMNHMADSLRRRIDQVMRQRNELDAVLSSMMEGVLALDADERILRINAAGAAMVGRRPEQLTGRTLQEAVRNPAFHQFVKAALAGDTPREADIRIRDDGERILNTHASDLVDHEGGRIGILIVFADVTRLRRLENMRRDFAANVSHEIKTPLTAISGFVETLLDGALKDPAEAQRFLEIIQRHVRRLTAIIDELMRLARLEATQSIGAIAPAPSNIRGVLESAVEACKSAAEAKDIRIILDCDDQIRYPILPDLFHQAAFNLLDNAIKYSNEGGSVRVAVSKTDAELRIRFEDEGIGIPAAHIPRLFERFYRVDRARSRKEGGTGLGLAIVKHIVAIHGGEVEVESAVGRGSAFVARLPLARGAESAEIGMLDILRRG